MIIGVGCDIVDHELTRQLKWDKKPSLINRILSEEEQKHLSSEQAIKFISGRFAAKEAVLKSLGTFMQDGISLRDIEILKSSTGKPFVKIHGAVKDIADHLGVSHFSISLSHSENISIAFVIAERLGL
jgi:holo-[acyl-carrier protein] synthase